MRSFKDSRGREWLIDITVDAIRRVREANKINLLEVLGGDLLRRLGDDPLLVYDIIWTLCKRDGVDEKDFAGAIRGETLTAASEALLEELADFFQSRGPALRAAMNRVSQATSRVVTAVVERINGPEMDQLLEKELGSIAGGSPASSESTPDPSRSASST